MLLVWLLLLFVAHVPSGAIHLLYAGAIILFARRILAGRMPVTPEQAADESVDLKTLVVSTRPRHGQ